jgi:prevent-host-death family protein
MKSSLLTLRRSPGKILDAIETGQEVTLTRRGKAIARIVPAAASTNQSARAQLAFGMWQDAEAKPVADQVRELRKGRSFDL